jgi:hypothetical protein
MYSESTSILYAEGETWQFCLLLNYGHKIQHSKKASLPVEHTSFEFFVCDEELFLFKQTYPK